MMFDQYVWFLWSLSFLVPWLIIFRLFPHFRRVMLYASLATMPFGLTEPLFVPDYWLPPSLFNLAATTGFDVESLIFCFTIGGIGVVLYNVLTRRGFEPVPPSYRRSPIHRHHKAAIATPFAVFPVLYFLPWNPIYPAVVAMLAGVVANLICRPDLKSKTWVGGVLFLFLYLIYIGGLELFRPGYIESVWQLGNLSGVTLWSIPIEEHLFAFSFGMYWAGVYEHLTWKRPTGQKQ